ncbi:MAG: hypothetical protein WC755_06310 [Candidatus Woesearchaeota archaeon]|jgi:hypothetical protein
MKTIIIIIVLLTATILIAVNTVPNPNITEVIVLRDITDNHLAQPNTNEILSLFGLENKWNGGIFHFTTITDVSYNQTEIIKLEPRNEWLTFELDRDKEVKKFKNDISEIFTNSEKDIIGKKSTSVYAPTVNELNKLSKSKAQNRILLLYTNLMENNSNISFYDNGTLSKLKTNPDSIQKYFESQVPLQKLNGIKIIMIYKPSDEKEDEDYKIVSEFYKRLFESKGAEVEIVANIN